jgi:hypothetical protein
MLIRPLVASLFIFIFIMIGIYNVYIKTTSKNLTYQINPNQHWLGVIDMNSDHGIDMAGVIKGDDALLVLDYSNPLFLQLIQTNPTGNLQETIQQFEISRFDSNTDTIINQDDPIFPFLKVITFLSDSESYEVRSLLQAGIRGIRIYRSNDYQKYQAIMSDGSTRNLYMTNNVHGTSVYKTTNGTVVTPLTEAGTS